ncbi:hypothetical protein RBB50_008417 [Rhinocladiella similis]
MASIKASRAQDCQCQNGVGSTKSTILGVEDRRDIPEDQPLQKTPNVNPSRNNALGNDSLHVSRLWTMMHKMVPPRPNPRARSTRWSYAQMRPELMKAAETVTAEEAERRVLILVNQAIQAPYTTDTIYAGLQIVMPGEIAPAHRHRAFALRFIIEGHAGFTAVAGEKITMRPGDVILTPSGAWHDHGNEGTEPIIWLDGLDLPLWQFLPINFLQPYSEARYPSKSSPESTLRFPWSDVAKKLDDNPSQHATYLYKHRDGTHLSSTISAQAERISPGFTTDESQQVFSFVYHVYEGEGFTTITHPSIGTEEKLQWNAKDTFSIPAWSVVSHTCTSNTHSAYLFAINDRPIVEALTFADAEFLT